MAYLLKATVVLLSISPSLQTFFKYESTAGPVIVSGDDAPNPFGTGTDKAPGARYTYGYNGETGDKFWELFNPACAGKIQSPINIEPNSIEFKTTLSGVLANPNKAFPDISYGGSSAGKLKHYGDTMKFYPDSETGTFKRGNMTFKLAQWHIHVPSEHRVNGQDYAAEVHFVHYFKEDSGKTHYAVIGVFVDLASTSSPFIASLAAASKPLKYGQYATYNTDYSAIQTTIKGSSSFYRYTGSLTTPPCLEGVKWLVASTPGLNISIADLNTLKGKIKYSARVPLPLFDMYDQDWVSKRKSDYFPENA